jgi:hypothetical protein
MLPFSDAIKWSTEIVTGKVIVCGSFVALEAKLPKRRQETVFAFLSYWAIVSSREWLKPSNYQIRSHLRHYPLLLSLLSLLISSAVGCIDLKKKESHVAALSMQPRLAYALPCRIGYDNPWSRTVAIP